MQVESRIEQVTLYARGALVRRVTVIPLGSVSARARIVGLPAAVIDDTVRASATGGALVTALHVGLDAPDEGDAADEDTAEVRAGRLRVAHAEAEIARLEAALAIAAAAPIAVAAARGEPPAEWAAMVDARRALVTLRADRELALRGQLAAQRREAEDARRVLAAALDRDRRTGSARIARLHELRKHVELELARSGDGDATVHLEYQVAAARWTPSYVARLDGDRVRFELRAAVAQLTGEDWTGVALRLSTAEPERFGALPELAAQRIGRRQAEVPRTGFRAPPIGAAALYLDYTRAFPEAEQARRRRKRPTTQVEADAPAHGGRPGAFATEVWDEESSRAKQAFEPPPGGRPMPPAPGMPPGMPPAMPTAMAPMPPGMPPAMPPGMPGMPAMSHPPMVAQAFMDPSAAPARRRSQAVGGAMASAMAMPGGPGGGGGAAGYPAAGPPPPPPPPPARLDYTNLRMAPPGARDRGTLVAAPRDRREAAVDGEVVTSIARVNTLALPAGCSDDWPHTYDYAFATDGAVDVRADGAWHSIAVTAKPSTAKLRHVAVPRQQADVFRIAVVGNPLAGPLLPGPIDVYDRGSFLVTSTIEHTPPGATVEIGLGVDAQVKLSRNTEFREETTGVLRGGLRLHHAIKIDVDNLSERAIELEVRERLPVVREGDDDVEVIPGRIEPAWERWTPDPGSPGERRLRGGYRWRLSVPAGQARALRAAYEVKIAGKLELVGGNRREP
jgi:hypothetical protein